MIYPLRLQNGHLLIRIGPEWFLIDTGCPQSFTERGVLWIDGRYFRLPRAIGHVSLDDLRRYTGEPGLSGLLGNNVLNQFDHIWNTECGRARMSSKLDLGHMARNVVPLHIYGNGVPVIDVAIGNEMVRALFDTGAQLSYVIEEDRIRYPKAPPAEDFYPGFGKFTVPTNLVSMGIGDSEYLVRCASMPPSLGLAPDIIGNTILKDRVTGYFPRRREMALCH